MDTQKIYDGNGWSQYEKLVLYRLDLMAEDVAALDAKVDALILRAAITRFQFGLIGGLTGLIGGWGVPALLAWIFKVK